MSTITKPQESAAQEVAHRTTRFENLQSDRLWVGCVAVAIVLMIVSYFLPLWKMHLLAPQYPAGLDLVAYGNRMEGDLREINSLNHYVGVKPIKPDSVFELKLFPSALWLTVAILVASALMMRPGWKRYLVAALLWAFPIGLLLDLQYWLYNYGHDRDPSAPYRIDDFTTKVIGTTHVVNFTSKTMVAAGFWTMVSAALLVTIGPQTIRALRAAWQNTGTTAAAASAGGSGVLLLARLGALGQGGSVNAQSNGQPTIAALIAAASPGDTVTVPPGTYREQVVVDKSITLVGEGRPVIDGGGVGDVIKVTADGVTIRGFVITGSGTNVSDEPTAIRLLGDNAVIEDNILRDVLYGVTLIQSDGHTIRRNQISSIEDFSSERRGHGVYLYSTSHNTIEDNVITRTKDGIFLGFAFFNTIRHNRVTDVRYGIHYMYADDNVFTDNTFTHSTAGGALMYSRRLRFERNEFGYNRSEASGYGLLFKDVDDVYMEGNIIHHNRLGITMEGAPHTPGSVVEIKNNLIGFNQVAIELTSTTGAVFTGNTFVGNLGHQRALRPRCRPRELAAARVVGHPFGDDVPGALPGLLGRRHLIRQEAGGQLDAPRRVEDRLLEDLLRQRLQAALARQLGPGAALRAERQVQVLDLLQRLSALDGLLQLGCELALLRNALGDGLLALIQVAERGQPVAEAGELYLVQPAGVLLAVAGDEREGVVLVEERDGALDLVPLETEVAAEPTEEVLHAARSFRLQTGILSCRGRRASDSADRHYTSNPAAGARRRASLDKRRTARIINSMFIELYQEM